MELSFHQILNSHKNQPAILLLHGPSLDTYKDKLQDLFINGKLRKCYQEITLDELKRKLAG